MRVRTFFVLVLVFVLPLWAVTAHADSILQTAGNFAVLGGSATTNTGATTLTGDYGVSPGTSLALTGVTLTGASAPHATDAVAAQAQADLTTAYNALNGLLPTTTYSVPTDLAGLTLTAGVYKFATSASLSGTAPLTLDFQNAPNQSFIFQIGSTLITASGPASGPGDAIVNIINPGANDALYWVVGSAATIGTYTQFEGNILSLAQIALLTGATINCGRALNQTPGPVTMDTNTIGGGCTGVLGETSGGLTGGSTGGGTTLIVPAPGGGTTTLTVPEPSTFALLSTGLIGLLMLRKLR
jgi:hypothetical protein